MQSLNIVSVLKIEPHVYPLATNNKINRSSSRWFQCSMKTCQQKICWPVGQNRNKEQYISAKIIKNEM